MYRIRTSTAIVILLLLSASLIGKVPAIPAGDTPGGFTDITKESGIADIVAKHQQYMARILARDNDDLKSWWLSGFTLVDMDGDGVLDLHLGGHGMQAVAARNDGHGHFTAVDFKPDLPRGLGRNNEIPYPGGEIRMAFDVDEDGKPDLLTSYHDGGGVTYLNTTAAAGDGATPAAWKFKPMETGFDAFSRAAAFVDLNRDGLVDYLITGDEGGGKTHPLHIYLGKGGGKWEEGPSVQVLREAGAIPCDINGDGYVDLLVSQRGYNDSKRWILINDGKMGFRNATKECGLNEAGSIMGVGDVNQDGTPDLICIEPVGPDKGLGVVFYLNDGKGHFTRSAPLSGITGPGPETGNWGGAVVTDFDNDGIADVVVNGKPFLYFFRGLGGGKFEYANDLWHIPAEIHPAVDEGLCFGDINGDGMLDVVTCGRGPDEGTPGIAVLRNDLPRRHWLNVQLIGNKGNRAAPGSIIRIIAPDTGKLFWYDQVCIWGRQSFQSYYTMANTERHFGMGNRTYVDVSVEFYPSGKKVLKKGVKVDQTVVIQED